MIKPARPLWSEHPFEINDPDFPLALPQGVRCGAGLGLGCSFPGAGRAGGFHRPVPAGRYGDGDRARMRSFEPHGAESDFGSTDEYEEYQHNPLTLCQEDKYEDKRRALD